MKPRRAFLVILLLCLSLLAAKVLSPTTAYGQERRLDNLANMIIAKLRLHVPVCSLSLEGPNSARCHVRVIVDDKGKPEASIATPSGYGPNEFQTAYGLGGKSASGRILAIVDAYDHPNIKSDLDFYNSTFGLPAFPTCAPNIATSSVPCFAKVDQNGGTNYPAVNSGWALEIALDVEAAHAACPDCKLLLVEANSNSYANLMTAVDRAVAMGAAVVSNSYGSREFSGETSFDSHFNHPGVAFTFSSGDSGYGTSYPAASKYVTSVGGTSLYLNPDDTWNSEFVWKGTGSGCSRYEAKPSFQHDTGCSRRTQNDVAADADPYTGAAVYDSVPYNGSSGWFQVGGTSLASPLIAAAYALGSVPSGTQANSLPYANISALHDITSGSNGFCNRRVRYLCTGVTGFDGPTGLGTPNGVAAF